jgi:Domain of unknown function (DUF4148)
MKVSRFLSVPVASLLAVGAAYAQSDKTSDQVRGELVDSQIAGDIYRGDIGMTERELSPGRYREAAQGAREGAGVTREQVRAELIAAVAAGDVYRGDIGLTERERGNASAGQSLSRAQVVADLVAARKAGQVPHGDIGMTEHESFPVRFPARYEAPGDLAAAGAATK